MLINGKQDRAAMHRIKQLHIDEYIEQWNKAFDVLAPNTAPKIQYKYNEPAIIGELSEYVDETYSEHYAQTSFQSTEVIIDSGHGLGFCLGNVLKYANRYGRKEGFNRKDLFKILHYTLIAIFIHDKKDKTNDKINNSPS